MRRSGWLATGAIVTMLAGCTGGGGNPATGAPPTTITGLSGGVSLQVPAGVKAPDTRVAFRPSTNAVARSPVSGVVNAIPVMAPIDIQVSGGQLAANRVRVTLKLPAGRPAGVYRNAYLAVFEPKLGTFVPLLDSKADPRTRTVSALAPHFSVYDAFVSTAKAVSGKVINWTDMASMPWLQLVPALNHAVQGIQQEAVDSLFGLSDPVHCNPVSVRAKVKLKDATHGQLLEACAQDYTDKSGRTFITDGNHYGFPILYLPPTGFTVGLKDFDFDNGTPLDLLRHLFWEQTNNVEVPGAADARFTLQPGTKLPASIPGVMDWGAVGVDMAYYLLTLVVPELKEMSPELRATLEEILSGVAESESNGAAGVEAFKESAAKQVAKLQSVAAQINPIIGALGVGECAYDGYKNAKDFMKGGFFGNITGKTSALLKIAMSCLGDYVAKQGGEMVALANGIAADLKAFPELVESSIAQNLKEVGVDVEHSTVKVLGIASPAPYLPSGTFYGYVSHASAEPNSLTFDEVEWFFGQPAAMNACQKYHEPPPHYGELCNNYYVHDLHRQYTMVVTGNVQVSDWWLPDGGIANPDKPISYAAFVARANGDSALLWKFTAKNSMITSISGVFKP